MINIWKDKVNDENSGQVFDKKLKLDGGARSHNTVRKQAFGELKNVIHNQPNVTPFKKLGQVATITKAKPATPRVCLNGHNRILNLKPKKDVTYQTPLMGKTCPIVEKTSIDFFDNFDFRSSCSKKCRNDNQNFWPECDNTKLEKIVEDFQFTEEDGVVDDVSSFGFNDLKDIDIDEMLSREKINIASFACNDSLDFSKKLPDLEDFLFE